MSRVLVTGASGFVGRRLCEMLAARGLRVRAAARTIMQALPEGGEVCHVGELGPDTDWYEALAGVDFVVHLAAKAHVLDRPHDDGEYQRINGEGTRRLAEVSARAGVRRFIYLSSIKVYGDGRERPFTAEETPQPTDVYGRSKFAGEEYLRDVARTSQMEFVIVRPPLVYGPRVRANFLRLMQWVDRELPLPLAWVHNSRSLVALDNLCDLLGHVLDHPAAAGRVCLVSDDDDVSTPELIRRIATAMGRRPRLLPVPPLLLRAAGSLLGRAADVERLLGSLTLDIAATRITVGWRPPLPARDAIANAVGWYLSTRDAR